MRKVIFISILSFTFSNTINVPDDYPAIQAGIDATNESDTVLVETGYLLWEPYQLKVFQSLFKYFVLNHFHMMDRKQNYFHF